MTINITILTLNYIFYNFRFLFSNRLFIKIIKLYKIFEIEIYTIFSLYIFLIKNKNFFLNSFTLIQLIIEIY